MTEFEVNGTDAVCIIVTVALVLFAIICKVLKWSLIAAGIFIGIWFIGLIFGFDLIAYLGGLL